MGLTDEQWAALEPLVEACRPRAKTPPRHTGKTWSPARVDREDITPDGRAASDTRGGSNEGKRWNTSTQSVPRGAPPASHH